MPEAVKLSEYTEEDLLRAFRRESYILGQRQITACNIFHKQVIE